MNMTEMIRGRRSVRTFDGTPLREEDAARILEFAGKVENPYELPIQWKLLDRKSDKLSVPVIDGTDTYIAGKMRRDPSRFPSIGNTEKTAVKTEQQWPFCEGYLHERAFCFCNDFYCNPLEYVVIYNENFTIHQIDQERKTKMDKRKSVLALLLCLVLCLSLFPATVFAEEKEDAEPAAEEIEKTTDAAADTDAGAEEIVEEADAVLETGEVLPAEESEDIVEEGD